MQTVVLGGGCFWCIEAVFKQLKGVQSVLPGYAGGERPDPTYEQVCSQATGHAEVVQVTFDEVVIPFEIVLEIFFSVHDPTTPNRQGHDVGEQYRSVIFFTTPEQESVIKNKINQLEQEKFFTDPIVTQVLPLDKFYEAEDYHHDYFAKNPDQTYCQVVINPKLKKFKDKWKSLIR